MTFSNCTNCNKQYIKHRANKGTFCSRQCYWETKKNVLPKQFKNGGFFYGRKHTAEYKEYMRNFAKGNNTRFEKGEKHPKYINGYSIENTRGFLGIQWANKVKTRDGYTCKINNSECKGRLEAHHILNWKSYPELRYDINNGITLCSTHHPRSRVLETQKVEEFKLLINNK